MDNYTYTETTSCPLCGYTENESIIMEDIQLKGCYFTLGVNECISCSLCYVSPRLNVEGLSLLYNEEYLEHTVSGIYNVSENVSEKEYFQFAKYLNKEFPTGGSVLDIGCGVGLMLDAINKNCTNIKAQGIEFSRYAGHKAQEKGHCVHLGDITQMNNLKPESFDGIVILYVLEHVPNPIDVLKKCYSLLKKNGKLFIAVPNYRYLKLTHTGFLSWLLYGKRSFLFSGEHLFNYTPRTIANVLDKSGFIPFYFGQAKPLKVGTGAQRLVKLIFAGIFEILFKLGYQLGGIHIIAKKKNITKND